MLGLANPSEESVTDKVEQHEGRSQQSKLEVDGARFDYLWIVGRQGCDDSSQPRRGDDERDAESETENQSRIQYLTALQRVAFAKSTGNQGLRSHTHR